LRWPGAGRNGVPVAAVLQSSAHGVDDMTRASVQPRPAPRRLAFGALAVAAMCAVAAPAAAKSVPYDFDGDGRQELVAGLPVSTQGGMEHAGSVLVIPGARGGLDLANRLITQASDGVPDDVEFFDTFGASLASGDFDADGYADLAIGSDEAR
jgi:FG-GAP repeat protein